MTQSQGNDDLYSKCSYLFNCGNIQDVGFPFWGGNRPNSCGHPALQLACEDDAASITISNVKYKVLDIDHNSEVLNIAREDFSTGICSPDFTNTTFDPALFSMVNGYSNFTIIYGCPGVPSARNSFSCTISGRGTIYGYGAPGALGPGSCSESVVIPISRNLLSQLAYGMVSLEVTGKQGFEVRLEVDSATCKRCAHSKGVCGYYISKNTTACYCADGSSASAICSPSAADGPQGQPPQGQPPQGQPPEGQPPQGQPPQGQPPQGQPPKGQPPQGQPGSKEKNPPV
ncbi:hypothetical protein EUGRSUZ_F02098 [Eucalyptus grandis]|uniref:Uncharacterized protein n=2 Tax=Eucalyptus grandis TaxID=71139 RepID=A0ACC3KIA9_EUCGR|nr:hypothetical protein EUGRSUZ_F02098 [Eucalyptus grandis]